MNCRETRKYLSAFQDNELDVRTNIELLEHLEMCDSCAARLEEHRRLKAIVASHIGSIRSPEALRRKIVQGLASAHEYGFLSWLNWRDVVGAVWFKPAAAAASIILVFGLVYGVLLAPPTPPNAGAARAHLTWLTDQVPNFIVTNDTRRAQGYAFVGFARKPEVSLFDNRQFELVGAGPAEIKSISVGHFVFRYKAVTVSMFVFEGLDLADVAGAERQVGKTTVKVDSRAGMNLVAWKNGGFVYILASGLPQSDLLHIAAPGT